MANYINTTTGAYPVSETQIRAEYSQTSFGTPFQAPEEFAVVFPAPTPTFNPDTQYCREIAPLLTSKGHYEQQYEVIDFTQEEIDARAEQKRIAAIPAQVSPRQIRQALNAAGLRQQVEDAIAAGDQNMKDWWEFSLSIERNHPLVIAMAAALNVTERELDDLFTAAGQL